MTASLDRPNDGPEQLMYKGKRISVVLSTIKTPHSAWNHESVRFGFGVAVMPVIDGKVFFVRQYRPSVSEFVLELPAGKLEPGEDPEEGGRRELKEETGISGGVFSYLGTIMTTPGFCDERIHLFLSTGGVLGKSSPDEDEEIDLVSMSVGDVYKAISDGSLRDGKTLSALALYWSDIRSGNR